MVEADVIHLVQRGLIVTLQVSAPILILSMTVGLVISILQTTTSIQEQTLTFVPKLIAVFVGIAFFFAYMLHTLMDYTRDIYNKIQLF
ncbi:MAG: flagellar biosynthesis protein FliQ [Spirochaetales bacterium]|nr:flagellar biosynthesis protein FliQ [Leptospiraceae bacterium]MCP5483228.1 flagellar biosynthesis protein FliQ [Spirochaetales bacterium]MCP5486797.1 flagellar biosynthesis protein FliQ [Spirochaetales bacterium]